MPVLLSGDTRILFHITPTKNLQSIYENGVCPEFSTGKLDASWYVNKHGVLWAIAHVSARHNISVNEISVCAVLIEWKSMRRTARPGFYYTIKNFTIENASPAEWYISPEEN